MKNKTQLRKAYHRLITDKSLTPQKRGFEFERLLYKLFTLEQLQPSGSFRVKGEQTDGMLKFGSNYYLLEARWWKNPVSATHLQAFTSKVSSKFIGTRGVFLSMSDFSESVPDALRFLPYSNVLLFDRMDIDYCFNPKYSFSDILDVKLRYAAQLGIVNYPFKRYLNHKK